MSGGSMNYFYGQLEEYSYQLGDKELCELAKDLAKVFHDKEWCDSGDISEGEFNKTVKEFKEKWFTERGQKERYEKYILGAMKDLRRLFRLDEKYCKDCVHWERHKNGSSYGQCDGIDDHLMHGFEFGCEKFARKGK